MVELGVGDVAGYAGDGDVGVLVGGCMIRHRDVDKGGLLRTTLSILVCAFSGCLNTIFSTRRRTSRPDERNVRNFCNVVYGI